MLVLVMAQQILFALQFKVIELDWFGGLHLGNLSSFEEVSMLKYWGQAIVIALGAMVGGFALFRWLSPKQVLLTGIVITSFDVSFKALGDESYSMDVFRLLALLGTGMFLAAAFSWLVDHFRQSKNTFFKAGTAMLLALSLGDYLGRGWIPFQSWMVRGDTFAFVVGYGILVFLIRALLEEKAPKVGYTTKVRIWMLGLTLSAGLPGIALLFYNDFTQPWWFLLGFPLFAGLLYLANRRSPGQPGFQMSGFRGLILALAICTGAALGVLDGCQDLVLGLPNWSTHFDLNQILPLPILLGPVLLAAAGWVLFQKVLRPRWWYPQALVLGGVGVLLLHWALRNSMVHWPSWLILCWVVVLHAGFLSLILGLFSLDRNEVPGSQGMMGGLIWAGFFLGLALQEPLKAFNVMAEVNDLKAAYQTAGLELSIALPLIGVLLLAISLFLVQLRQREHDRDKI